jgi:hypothetical protein
METALPGDKCVHVSRPTFGEDPGANSTIVAHGGQDVGASREGNRSRSALVTRERLGVRRAVEIPETYCAVLPSRGQKIGERGEGYRTDLTLVARKRLAVG